MALSGRGRASKDADLLRVAEPLPCSPISSARPAKGNDESKVEGLVGYARRNFMVPIPLFNSWEACVQNFSFLPILSGMWRITVITQRQ